MHPESGSLEHRCANEAPVHSPRLLARLPEKATAGTFLGSEPWIGLSRVANRMEVLVGVPWRFSIAGHTRETQR